MSETQEVEELEPGWLNTDQAAARMRLSRRQFETRWRSGDFSFPRYKVNGDRTYYYDPKDLATSDLDDLREADIIDTPTAALLAQAYSHNELMMKQYMTMTAQLLQHSTDENQKLRDRCNQLEQTQHDLIKAREDMLNDQHARDMAERELTKDAERKDQALKWLIDTAPLIMKTHAAGKLQHKAVKFLDTISPEQILMLLEINKVSDPPMLSEEQVTFLESALEVKQKQPMVEEPEPEVEEKD